MVYLKNKAHSILLEINKTTIIEMATLCEWIPPFSFKSCTALLHINWDILLTWGWIPSLHAKQHNVRIKITINKNPKSCPKHSRDCLNLNFQLWCLKVKSTEELCYSSSFQPCFYWANSFDYSFASILVPHLASSSFWAN